jgi:hypothetical protein
MSPTDNAVNMVPADAREVIQYYATCEGTNPIEEPLLVTYNYTNLLNDTITQLTGPGGACPGDPYILSCYEDVDTIFASLNVVEDTAACPPLKEQWDSIVDDATCDSVFYGVLHLWSGQYVTATVLCLLLITGSICYNFFDIWFDDEDTSPFTDGVGPSSSDPAREKSITLSATTSRNSQSDANANVGNGVTSPVAYSTNILYGDSSSRNEGELEDEDMSTRKLSF